MSTLSYTMSVQLVSQSVRLYNLQLSPYQLTILLNYIIVPHPQWMCKPGIVFASIICGINPYLFEKSIIIQKHFSNLIQISSYLHSSIIKFHCDLQPNYRAKLTRQIRKRHQKGTIQLPNRSFWSSANKQNKNNNFHLKGQRTLRSI